MYIKYRSFFAGRCRECIIRATVQYVGEGRFGTVLSKKFQLTP